MHYANRRPKYFATYCDSLNSKMKTKYLLATHSTLKLKLSHLMCIGGDSEVFRNFRWKTRIGINSALHCCRERNIEICELHPKIIPQIAGSN